MAKSGEAKLWERIKNLKLNYHMFRVESRTVNGIPDVSGLGNEIYFWLELKANDRKDYGLSKWQMNWHTEHNAKGGNAFILLKALKQKGLKLLRVEARSVKLVAEGEDNEQTLRSMLSRCVFPS
jgi:hypothetical protein